MPEPLDGWESFIPSPPTFNAAVNPFPMYIYNVGIRSSSSLHLIFGGNHRVDKDTTVNMSKIFRRIQLTTYVEAEEIVQNPKQVIDAPYSCCCADPATVAINGCAKARYNTTARRHAKTDSHKTVQELLRALSHGLSS